MRVRVTASMMSQKKKRIGREKRNARSTIILMKMRVRVILTMNAITSIAEASIPMTQTQTTTIGKNAAKESVAKRSEIPNLNPIQKKKKNTTDAEDQRSSSVKDATRSTAERATTNPNQRARMSAAKEEENPKRCARRRPRSAESLRENALTESKDASQISTELESIV